MLKNVSANFSLKNFKVYKCVNYVKFSTYDKNDKSDKKSNNNPKNDNKIKNNKILNVLEELLHNSSEGFNLLDSQASQDIEQKNVLQNVKKKFNIEKLTSQSEKSEKFSFANSKSSSNKSKKFNLDKVMSPSNSSEKFKFDNLKSTTRRSEKFNFDNLNTLSNKSEKFNFDRLKSPNNKSEKFNFDNLKSPSYKSEKFNSDHLKSPSNKSEKFNFDHLKSPSNKSEKFNFDHLKSPSNKSEKFNFDHLKFPSNKSEKFNLDHLKSPSNKSEKFNFDNIMTPSNKSEKFNFDHFKSPSNKSEKFNIDNIVTPSNKSKKFNIDNIITPINKSEKFVFDNLTADNTKKKSSFINAKNKHIKPKESDTVNIKSKKFDFGNLVYKAKEIKQLDNTSKLRHLFHDVKSMKDRKEEVSDSFSTRRDRKEEISGSSNTRQSFTNVFADDDSCFLDLQLILEIDNIFGDKMNTSWQMFKQCEGNRIEVLTELLSNLNCIEYFQDPKEIQDFIVPTFITVSDPSKRLNIFQKRISQNETSNQSSSSIIDLIESHELRKFNRVIPNNSFHEAIMLTKDKKMWNFPIDNDQDSEELNIGFHEHVFPQQYLTGKLPMTGMVGQFMNYVCMGLSKNPHLTVNEKKAHIKWYEDYLSNKLEEIDMAMKKSIEDKKYEELLRNKR